MCPRGTGTPICSFGWAGTLICVPGGICAPIRDLGRHWTPICVPGEARAPVSVPGEICAPICALGGLGAPICFLGGAGTPICVLGGTPRGRGRGCGRGRAPPRILHVARADAQTNTNAEIRERAPEKCPPPVCPALKSKTLRLSDVLKCSCIRNETLADSNRLKNAGTIYSNVQINALNANLFRK